jgi:hypothetical protein
MRQEDRVIPSPICGLLALVLALSGCTLPSQIRPGDLRAFTTDGCSGGFPEGPPGHPNLWCDCCVAHDLAYWKGGTREQRKAADDTLRECVADKGKAVTGTVMEIGVRAGGTPYVPTSYRWGYGWPFVRGYLPLTPEEEHVAGDKGKDYEQARSARCN